MQKDDARGGGASRTMQIPAAKRIDMDNNKSKIAKLSKDGKALPKEEELKNVQDLLMGHLKEKIDFEQVSVYKKSPEPAAGTGVVKKQAPAAAPAAEPPGQQSLILAPRLDLTCKALVTAPAKTVTVKEAGTSIELENPNDFPACYKIKTTNHYIEASHVKGLLPPFLKAEVRVSCPRKHRRSYADEHITVESVPCCYGTESTTQEEIENIVKKSFAIYKKKPGRKVIKVKYAGQSKTSETE